MMLSCLFVMYSCVNGMESKDNSKKFHAREKMAIKNYLQIYQRNPYESRCSDKLLKLMIRGRIQSGTLIMNAQGCLVEPQKEVDFFVQACMDAMKPFDPQDYPLFIHEHGLQERQIPNYRDQSVIIKYMQADNDLSSHGPRYQRPECLSSEKVQKILDKINEEK